VVEELCDEPDLAPKAKESLFRITQEAMQNIAKHSRATSVHLRLESRESTLRLEITDNGVGFDAAQEFPGHLGLQSMRERASAVGGELALTSDPGEGTRVAVMIATGVIT
jgi:signal transduction histidine kinase